METAPVGITSAQIKGTGTNDNAAAGAVGELITATVASGAAVVLTTAVAANVTSISLTAGDWDITGVVDYTFAGTTSYTQLLESISLTSATLSSQAGGGGLGTDPNTSFAVPATVPGALPFTRALPTVRLIIAATTTVFLVAQAAFTVAALSAYGPIRARRAR